MSIYENSQPRHFHVSNNIHPTAVVHNSVHMGKNNVIGPYCVIHEGVTIGDGNFFAGHVSVGSPAEHRDYDHTMPGPVVIGDNNKFREFVTINRPTTGVTKVGNDCFVMRGGHISHDTVLQDKVTMSCDVILGGHSTVMEGAYMGIGSATHPFIVVGPYSIVGMGAVCVDHVYPVAKVMGIPAKHKGLNTVGIERAKLTKPLIKTLTDRFNRLVAK